LKDGVVSERTSLEEITIRSIGVIEHSSIEFSNGLTVLSGETGAGKTMILTALNLILGGKSDSALVRKGSERLIASGRFSIPQEYESTFEEALVEDGELIITRTVTLDGKSKGTTNGVSATASTLSTLGDHLVEVHGQAANHMITKPSRQLELVDRFGAIDITSYLQSLSQYHEIQDRISSLKKSIDQKDKELTELRDFVRAFEKLNPQVGEFSEIESEISRLSSVEELRLATAQSIAAIDNEEAGSLTSIGSARRALENARNKDLQIEGIYQEISESFFVLTDVLSSLNSYINALEADPLRLDYLQTRKAEINSFIKRFGSTGSHDDEIAELVARYKDSSDAISDLEGGDIRLKELEQELTTAKKSLLGEAKKLTDSRNKAASKLSSEVTAEIQQLSMPHAVFIAQVNSADYQAPKESDFTSSGCDHIVMSIQSHKDAPVIPLGKGASGGEMSRVMLALEVVIANTHPIGTYVFDEVDAGVGGKAAIEVGRRLHKLAQSAQVIVVTHLPQVAAWADAHFVVSKNSDGSVNHSDVIKVEGRGALRRSLVCWLV
jgi:DNA repair protein RecN (Recombination protein N)